MLPHGVFCDECGPKFCVSRANLPTCRIDLKINYTLIEIEEFHRRKRQAAVREYDLDVRYSGEYVARPLPHCGLDMIFNHTSDAMLSDRADFNFHDHDFEITETIELDHEAPARKVFCPLETNTKSFIGDVRALTDKSGRHTYWTDNGSEELFQPVYMDGQMIGYSMRELLRGYDAINERMWSDEGYYCEMVLRYTDKATNNADGIMFAGSQNENYMNFQEYIDDNLEWCAGCRKVNGIPGKPGSLIFPPVGY